MRSRRASLRPLPRRFFARSTLVVARALLGRLLVHETPSGRLVGRIVETEAYRGAADPASHAHLRTPRSEVMFGRPGVAYVYFSYGVHHCLNVVTEARGRAGAVLLRALELLEGFEAAPDGHASGPGRLTAAMGVGPQHNGADLTRPPLYLADDGSPRGRIGRGRIISGPRIGISVAGDRPWRFGLAGHPALSRRFPPPL